MLYSFLSSNSSEKPENPERKAIKTMTAMRLTRFLIWLSFSACVMRSSFAYAFDRDWESSKMEHVLAGDDIVSSTQKRFLEGFTYSSNRKMGKMGLKGMEMVTPSLSGKETEEEKEGNHGGASEDISGKRNDGVDKSGRGSQDKLNHQRNMKSLGRKTRSASLGTPRSELVLQVHVSNKKHKLSQDSKTLPAKASLEHSSKSENLYQKNAQDTAQKEEMKRLANLMHKDYSKSPRKPPINNHIPFH